MPIMSPFRPKPSGHEVMLKIPDRKSNSTVSTMTLRASQKAVDTTMRRARVDKLVPSSDSSKPGLYNPPNVGWGSLDPSIPKKVSISRRTLHPSLRGEPADMNQRELEDIDQMPDFDEDDEDDFEQVHELSAEVHEMEGSPAGWVEPAAATMPAATNQSRRRSRQNARPRYDRRRSSSAPPNKYRNASGTPPMSPSRRSDSPARRWSEEESREDWMTQTQSPQQYAQDLVSPSPPVPPKSKHSRSLQVPVSRYSQAHQPIQRKHQSTSARKMSRTAQEAIDIRSSAASVETVYIALDQQSISSSPIVQQPPTLQPEPEPEHDYSRTDRYNSNKQLYYKMKAENHNLWVLLDASNRRADLMMQNLSAEEQRCKDLECKTYELQATLDTLNARRLWQQQEEDDDDDHSSNASSKRASSIMQEAGDSNAEIEQVTAELESLRRNLDQSRVTVRKMKSFTQEARDLQRQALPAATKLQATERELERSMSQMLPASKKEKIASKGHATLFTASELDARLRDLIKPTPVRPAAAATNASATPTSASRTPTGSPGAGEQKNASNTSLPQPQHSTPPPPTSEPAQYHELDAIETETTHNTLDQHRIASIKEAIEVSQVEFVSATPELSPPNSRPSSGADSTSSAAPSPPPKSTRRLTHRLMNSSSGSSLQSSSSIHPALRGGDNSKEPVQLVMAPLIEGGDNVVV